MVDASAMSGGSDRGDPSASAEPNPDLVRHQLDRILATSLFSRSQRYTGFLRYVVEHALAEPGDVPKERTIGIEVFGRKPDYDSEADPVVRISAAEVRRRLADYYADAAHAGQLRIELPRGHYRPEFTQADPHAAAGGPPLVSAASTSPSPSAMASIAPLAVLVETVAESRQAEQPIPAATRMRWRQAVTLVTAAGVSAILGMVAAFAWVRPAAVARQRALPPTLLQRFWAPALNAPGGVAISVGDMSDLKQLSGQVFPPHPNEFGSLSPQVQWTDVNWDDARAAADISAMLGPQLRYYRRSSETSPAAVNAIPTVFVGAFDNSWTIRLTADLPFEFRGGLGQPCCSIVDTRTPGRSYTASKSHDYALVARLNDGAGSVRRYIAAGVGPNGTVAAGELISGATEFDQMARFVPANWSRENIEILVRTDIVQGQAGPPIVEAARFW